jgi:cysteinyl-tRNA synthetase
MSRQVEEFQPINPPEVRLYACGFTVYDYTHLGHLRKYTMDDVLVRTLEHAGYDVKFVQNVTDVGHLTSDSDTGEDKLEKGARKYGKSAWDVAREFEEYFWRSMDLMGNLRPDVSCRATEHIQIQLEMVQELEKKGYTYEIPGDGIYFDTSKFPDYGKLARLAVDDQTEGARIGVVEGKRHPADFALWKFERPGENRAMSWPSPWAERSFPGWHIECSAMAIKYLGEQLDIHTGGIDHIPVHHTNEIAQAESATGKVPFVRYWVHHNFLLVDGEKMSKSLGNFFTIDDVLERGYSPRALRMLFLTTHYRSEMNFTWEALEGMQKAYVRLMRQVAELQALVGKEVTHTGHNDTASPYKTAFYEALENDLSTPEAVSVVWNVLSADLPNTEKLLLLEEFDKILQLDLQNVAEVAGREELAIDELPEVVRELMQQRQDARNKQDWDRADALRVEIEQHGFRLIDTPEGQKVERL